MTSSEVALVWQSRPPGSGPGQLAELNVARTLGIPNVFARQVQGAAQTRRCMVGSDGGSSARGDSVSARARAEGSDSGIGQAPLLYYRRDLRGGQPCLPPSKPVRKTLTSEFTRGGETDMPGRNGREPSDLQHRDQPTLVGTVRPTPSPVGMIHNTTGVSGRPGLHKSWSRPARHLLQRWVLLSSKASPSSIVYMVSARSPRNRRRIVREPPYIYTSKYHFTRTLAVSMCAAITGSAGFEALLLSSPWRGEHQHELQEPVASRFST